MVSGDPKEDHTYSSAKAAAARSASPASDCASSSSADEPDEVAAKGGLEDREGSFPSRESHSETEEDGRPRGPREAPGDCGPAHNPGLLHCRQILYHVSHQGSKIEIIREDIQMAKKHMKRCST